LASGLEKLQALKTDINEVFAHASAQFNPGWNEALDLKNLIITAEAVTRAALIREESRGAHTRLDFTGERDEGLEYNIIIKKTTSGMSAEKIQRDSPQKELADIAFASLKELEGDNLGA
jgi:succinate dehydrogenase / fumarate reductase flavoprotein subunit